MILLLALTVKVSVILLLALVGAACLRRGSAAARHWVLAVGVTSACAAPLVHVLPVGPVVRVAPVGPYEWGVGPVFQALRLGPYSGALARPADAGALPSAPERTLRGSFAAAPRPARATVPLHDAAGRFVVTIWLTGTTAGAGVLLVGLVRLRRLRTSSRRVVEGPLHRLCRDAAQSHGVRRGVELLLGPHPALIATWGWRRPAVMLPASASEWSTERMRVVLLHEIAHVRRGDWMMQMTAEALRCVFWFNPLAWWVRARLRRESEHAADDLVLARGVEATTCALHLVDLAREVREQRRTELPAPALARPSHLQGRVSTMLNPLTNRRPLSRVVRFLVLEALTLAAIFVGGLQVAAQTARVAGTVVDQAGYVVRNPGLRLTVRATGEQLRVTGDDDGRFEFVDLEPGEYSLGVSAPGYARLFRRLSLGAGAQVEQELVLELGSLEETITVTDVNETPPPRTISDAALARYRRNRTRGGTIVPPIKTRDQAPVYPASVRGSGFEGKVVLEALLKTDGTVGVVQILAPVDPATMTTVYPDLARAAVEAVGGWRYEPTLLHGVPVDTRMTISIDFRP